MNRRELFSFLAAAPIAAVAGVSVAKAGPNYVHGIAGSAMLQGESGPEMLMPVRGSNVIPLSFNMDEFNRVVASEVRRAKRSINQARRKAGLRAIT